MRRGASRSRQKRPPPVWNSSTASASGRALQKEVALTCVLRKRCRALELRARFVGASELCQKIAARARQEVVRLESRFRCERVDELKARRGTERHPHGDRTIQLHDR